MKAVIIVNECTLHLINSLWGQLHVCLYVVKGHPEWRLKPGFKVQKECPFIASIGEDLQRFLGGLTPSN